MEWSLQSLKIRWGMTTARFWFEGLEYKVSAHKVREERLLEALAARQQLARFVVSACEPFHTLNPKHETPNPKPQTPNP